MDFLNRSAAQVRDLFLSMTPGARLTSGLLLAVVLTSLVFLFRQGTAGPDAFLFGGEYLTSSQLQRIEAAIAGLDGYAIESNRIRVPRGQEAKFMAAIAEAEAMPADFHRLLEKAISAGGVFGSKEDKRQQIKAAREHQLSMWISAMQGVEEAFVIYHESEERVARSPSMKQRFVTASVNVRTASDDVLGARRVKAIRRLVANAIGSKPENVTVANIDGGQVFGGAGDDAIDATEHPYYQQQFLVESHVRKQIRGALSNIPGLLVEVGVELDPMTRESTKNVKVDKQTVPIRSTTRTEETESKNTTPGGRVGLEPNMAIGPGNNNNESRTAGRSNENRTTVEEETNDNIPSHTEIASNKIGLTPQRITATIRIPSDYWEKVWREKNKPADGSDPPEPSPDELNNFADIENGKIKDTIVTLLGGKETGENKYARVAVDTYHHTPPEPIAGPSLAKTALAWTGRNWTTLSMMGLAMFGLIMLRSMVKAVPPADSNAPVSPAFEIDSSDDDEDKEDPDRPRLRLHKGPSLKDDLGEIVREDPDAAASILRSWIGTAS